MTRPGDGWDRYGEELLEQTRQEKEALALDKSQPQFNQKFIDAIRERHAYDIWYLDELEALAVKYDVNPAIFEDGPGSGRRWYPGEVVSRYKNRFPDSEWPNGRAFASQPVKPEPPPLRVIEETWKPPEHPVPPPSWFIPENYRRGDKVLAVKVDRDPPRVLKSVTESIEPIQGQYYDAFKSEALLKITEAERARIRKCIANMFTGKGPRPIIVADNQPRLSSDGSTLVSDAYHWLPIANAPLNTKLQLINRADGVANYGTITNANRHLFTHYAELPTFKD